MLDFLRELGPVEWLAAIATLVNVALLVRADVRNYPFGVVAVLLYGWVFWTQKLYANAVLQIVYYLPMQFVGWWTWLRTGPQRDDDLPIRRLGTGANLAWVAITAVTSVAIGFWLAHGTNGHIPYLDAATTAISVVGQILLTRKWLENWVYWIVVDVLYIGFVFPSQHLWVSTALYTVLLGMSVLGFVQWLRAERRGAVHA